MGYPDKSDADGRANCHCLGKTDIEIDAHAPNAEKKTKSDGQKRTEQTRATHFSVIKTAKQDQSQERKAGHRSMVEERQKQVADEYCSHQ